MTGFRGGHGARLLRALSLLASLLAAPAFGGGVAAAHARGGDHPQVQGLVTGVGNTTLAVQTPGPEFLIPIARSTRVVRLVTGSSDDIKPGKWVDLHLMRGGRTADAILIEGTRSSSPKPSSTPRPSGTPTHKPPATNPSLLPSGQVVSLSGNSLTVHCRTGGNRTFTVTSNTSITEELAGSINDLAVGEIVRVLLGHPGSPALAIVILNA